MALVRGYIGKEGAAFTVAFTKKGFSHPTAVANYLWRNDNVAPPAQPLVSGTTSKRPVGTTRIQMGKKFAGRPALVLVHRLRTANTLYYEHSSLFSISIPYQNTYFDIINKVANSIFYYAVFDHVLA